MIIAIPVDDDKKSVCVAFGRTPLFLVCNTETGEQSFLPNPGAEAQGGAGMKAAQCVVDAEADVLITKRCGENAAEVMKAAEIQIFKSAYEFADDNISAFKAGKLEELTSFHGGYIGIL
ncbi:MAG: dinitrogenase iron-molybdenum cofactor biosynthesis protein [Ruminococcaceae bacterium]|nr:dinitrogenase iron-molybdenum cofactor biosynthesis protein [Oscillospiraceae bacterium]